MRFAIPLCSVALFTWSASAQISVADYQRANGLRTKYQGLAINVAGAVTWIDGTDQFWYRKSVRGGDEFELVDAEHAVKKPAFDHEKLAASLSMASGEHYGALALPFQEIEFADNMHALKFSTGGSEWNCELANYACRKLGPTHPEVAGRALPPSDDDAVEFQNDIQDGIVVAQPLYESPQQGGSTPASRDPRETVRRSPDGKWEALIQDYNVFLRGKLSGELTPLSADGSKDNYYTVRSIAWSPDSTHIAAYRVRPGMKREVHYIESSPSDQVQPKLSSREYAKPGDVLDTAQPVLFDVASRQQIAIDNALFPNPYSLTTPVWWKDSRGFTFEYNQRGHQAYRVLEVDAQTAKVRALIDEESQTFIDYRPLIANPRDTGKKVRYDLADGKEIIWGSERDGWEHLYLYDGATGHVKNQITKGNWVVRSIDKVDAVKRQIWFEASGMVAGQDPYFVQAYRINFDGSGLAQLTAANGEHSVKYSADMKFFVDTWSRVDQAPVVELRKIDAAQPVMEVERGDIATLRAAGWRAPEVFTAKGRDSKTDIWGVINWPSHFDPSKKYPVVESIYAGPQGSFVPKSFSSSAQALTEFGFIVVQIDGMGTNNRSRAFHDVAWKNLGDAGFPDRILWHQAVAAKYPAYDLTRVGVFGTSAGGQNAMGALLFHPEFYKVAVSNSGCHDNRMDKIWWNEQWMGWPLGPQYAASSNVDNAKRLKGKLLLVVGEMDTNVDPASTFQVVNALIKADKKFDLLFVPGGGHGAGGPYGQRLLEDFFVHNLLGEETPDWNNRPVHRPAIPTGGD